jgi:cytoskeleton protein RodZ
MTNPGPDGWSVATIRSTKGISLEQIASDTKLKVSTLKAIEAGDFEALPGGIYNISYIRQYARAIGADEGSLVELYRKTSRINPQSLAS